MDHKNILAVYHCALFLSAVLLFACVPKPVNLSMEDMEQARTLFYEVLEKKLTEVDGKDAQVTILSVKKHEDHLDTMMIEYALEYILPEKDSEPSAKVQYSALATLKGFYKDYKNKLQWQVLSSQQKEYQLDFEEGLIINVD